MAEQLPVPGVHSEARATTAFWVQSESDSSPFVVVFVFEQGSG